MKTHLTKSTHHQQGYALMMVMAFGGIGLLALAGA